MRLIQNNYYTKDQAWFLTRIIHLAGADSTKTRCLRVRLRSFHSGSPGSYAIVEVWANTYQSDSPAPPHRSTAGWVEVLDWDIGDLHCSRISYLSEDAGDYDIFDEDAKFLIGKALEVLNGGV
tara:strand:- start:7179 stop:7547 length:369 start_codon:yes stop_codon:yes gene_type:complete